MEKTMQQMVASEERALQLRSLWEGTWAECYDYTMPGHNGFTRNSPGTRGDDLIFDETAVVGVQEFSSRMIQGIVPSNVRWARLEPAPAAVAEMDEEQIKEVQMVLDDVNEYMFEVINSSNFSQETHEAFLDLAIGTASMTVEEGDAIQPIKFNAVPLSQVALEQGPYDSVGAQYRKRNVRADMIKTIWPNATLNTELTRMAREKPHQEVTVTEVTYRDWTLPNEYVYYYCVYLKKDGHKLYKETYSGLGSNPWVTFRWAKTSGEVYGRGPVYNSLAAIKTANLTVQLILENAELALSGVWQGDDDGVLNPANIRLIPGTVIPRSPGSRGLEALQFPGSFDVSQLVLSEMRHNINKALYNETLGRREGTPISATEVAERMAELSRTLGATYGRLQSEFVYPVVQRVLYLLRKQGRIEIPTVDGREIRIRAVSPMMRAQRNEDITQHINFAQVTGQLFGPQLVQTIINPTKFAQKIASWYEVDGALLRDETEQAQLAQQTGEALAQSGVQGSDVATQLKEFLP
jgi:hypothetical protein